MDTPYCLGYLGPEWLDELVESYCSEWGDVRPAKIGNTIGAPSVIISGNPKEIGSKQYDLLWADGQKIDYVPEKLDELLNDKTVSDIIIFPDRFDLKSLLTRCGDTGARVYIDINFGPDTLSELSALGREFETVILSTSSEVFKSTYKGSPSAVCGDLFKYCKTVLLKENRGGARLFDPQDTTTVATAGAQVRPVMHSVGVGDCFNAVFIVLRQRFGEKVALNYASSIAAEYACSIEPEDLRKAVEAWLRVDASEMKTIAGVSLPWEKRPEIQIYVAAPDFDWIDRSPINEIKDALEYHNFTPRFPVRENGQLAPDASAAERSRVAMADLSMLDQCKLLVAVMLYDDPGTLIEIGLALQRQMPVLVYDPYSRADNPMLTELPVVISADLDRIIAGVFSQAARLPHA